MKQILQNIHEPIIGKIIRKHNFICILDETPNGLNSWEEKLLYYADKRVRHDQLVSLQDRLNDLKKRYGGFESEEAKQWKSFPDGNDKASSSATISWSP